MSEIGLRLLKLQKEFSDRESDLALAGEFRSLNLSPRSVEEIAADYESALREFME